MEEQQVIDVEPEVIEEGSHIYEMLEKAKDIQVRDGDDLITINSVGEEDTPNDDVDGETNEETGEEYTPEETLPELQETESLETFSKQLDENRNGFEELTAKAIETGKVTQADIDSMLNEYEDKGTLSEATLSKLEEAGYPRKFIQSYIDAQEAVANRYINEIYTYAGGKDSFDKYVEHLGNTSPDTLDLLQDAVESGNLKTIKGILNLARGSMVNKYGRTQQRTVTTQARQTVAPRVEAFGSRQEMVQAMSDPRYLRDKAYTAEVRQKVYNSNF